VATSESTECRKTVNRACASLMRPAYAGSADVNKKASCSLRVAQAGERLSFGGARDSLPGNALPISVGAPEERLPVLLLRRRRSGTGTGSLLLRTHSNEWRPPCSCVS